MWKSRLLQNKYVQTHSLEETIIKIKVRGIGLKGTKTKVICKSNPLLL